MEIKLQEPLDPETEMKMAAIKKMDLKQSIEQRRLGLSKEKQELIAKRLRGEIAPKKEQDDLRRMFDETWKQIRSPYDDSLLKRVEQSIEIFYGAEKPRDSDPRQVTQALYFPGLTAKPWHDPKDFPWVPGIEAAFPKIKEELYGLLQAEEQFDPYQHPYTKELGWKGWGTYSLYRTGKWDELHCSMCPETVKAIRNTPHGLRECMFTKLQPGFPYYAPFRRQ